MSFNKKFFGPLTIFLYLILAAVLGSSISCGGGNSGGDKPGKVSARGRAKVSITWSAQTRLIPDASESIVVHLAQGATLVTSKTFARPAGGGTVSAEFGNLPVGTLTATANAYPTANGSGTAQATASTPVEITVGAVTPFSLTMDSTIVHLRLFPTEVELLVGQTQALMATPQNAADAVVLVTPANLTWQSSNPAAATINASGVITAVGMGTTTITVTETESGKSASVNVTVTSPTPPGTNEPEFATPATYVLPSVGEQVIAGDFDGDGNADVAVGSSDGMLMLYGKGDGTLEDYVIVNAHTTFGVRCIADINNDGRLDLLCGDNNGAYLFLNQGGRSLPFPITLNVGAVVSVAAFQMPGQANKDIAVVVDNLDLTGSTHVLRLQGNILQDVGTYKVPQLPLSVTAGDLTNDGLPDLVVTFLTSIVGQSGAIVFPGQLNGAFGEGGRYNTGTSHVLGGAIEDFNNDDRPDLVVSNYWDNNVGILLNTGGSSLAPALHYACNSYGRDPQAADFDGDGWMDVAVANAGSDAVTIVWNRGDTFTPHIVRTGGENSRSMDVADFNNDGKMDIVVGSENSRTISILLNTTP